MVVVGSAFGADDDIKETEGDLTDDTRREKEGEAQQKWGEAKDKVDRPELPRGGEEVRMAPRNRALQMSALAASCFGVPGTSPLPASIAGAVLRRPALVSALTRLLAGRDPFPAPDERVLRAACVAAPAGRAKMASRAPPSAAISKREGLIGRDPTARMPVPGARNP